MNYGWQRSVSALALLAILSIFFASSAASAQNSSQTAPQQGTKSAAPKQPPATKPLTETEELQRAIDRAAGCRALAEERL